MAKKSERPRKPKVRPRGGRRGSGVRVRASIIRDSCELSWLGDDSASMSANVTVTDGADETTTQTSDS